MAQHSMDATTVLEPPAEPRAEQPAEPTAASSEPACPRCAKPATGPRPLATALFPDVALRRCARCGARYSAEEGAERPLLICGSCELPYLAARGEEQGSCPDCLAGRVPDDLPHAALAAATEQELLSALESRWRFLTSDAAAIYLESLVRLVAKKIDGAPPACRVVLTEDSSLKTLALPSGTILLSQETLDEVEDEAQLAFLLAHELVHASSDAQARLIRIGLRTVARDEPAHDEESWAEIAEDLVRLGYGPRSEREADERALQAVLDLGYDADSVVRYLRHIEMLGNRADDRVRELLLAHPPVGQRIRIVEAALDGRVEAGEARRVNREVLRRAARRHASEVTVARLGEVAGAGAEEPGAVVRRSAVSWLPWAAALAALLAALLFLLR